MCFEYVAKFTELARFGDDYVATDMAKVKKFEDGLKFSIRGKIVGFLLQDMDSMVRTQRYRLSGTGYNKVRVTKVGLSRQMVVFSIGDGLWFPS